MPGSNSTECLFVESTTGCTLQYDEVFFRRLSAIPRIVLSALPTEVSMNCQLYLATLGLR
jgi:hypothetical protein